jgi:hypothetical protein
MKSSVHILAAVMLAWAGSAHAVMLEYSGNNFTSVTTNGPTTPSDSYTTSDSLQGWIELASMLGPNLSSQIVTPLAFSFSDGVNTLTNSNTNSASFRFWTDALGMPTEWEFFAEAFFPTDGNGSRKIVQSIYRPSDPRGTSLDEGEDVLCGPTSTTTGCAFFGDPFYDQRGSNLNSPGTWEYRTNEVPAPTTLALLGLGLLGVGYRRRQH